MTFVVPRMSLIPRLRTQAFLLHQPSHTMFATAFAQRLQIVMHLVVAITALGDLFGGFNFELFRETLPLLARG